MSDLAIDTAAPARPFLFQPFNNRGLTLKNRLVVPPMVHYRAAPGSAIFLAGHLSCNVHLERVTRWEGFGLCSLSSLPA